MENTGYDFEFVQVEKPYESYTGNNVKLRYVLHCCVLKYSSRKSSLW